MHKILLVEDNPVNRKLIHRRLSKTDYLIGEAHDGEAGVSIAYHCDPDLILMDMSLPCKDGWTATMELRSYEKTRHIPIIALTAHAMERDKIKAMEAGCDGFVSKPIDFVELNALMKQLLAKKAEPAPALA